MAEIHDAYTSVMLHFDGADAATTFTDEIGTSWGAYGTAQLDTAQSKFGTASGWFDGNSDYLLAEIDTKFDLSGTDWTIDCWFRSASFAAVQTICAKSSYGSYFDWSLHLIDATHIACYTNSANSNYTVTVPTMSADTWYHVALVRAASALHVYLNGVEYGTGSTMAITNLVIGANVGLGCVHPGSPSRSQWFGGWIDEFRVSKGVARWLGNFVPPTLPHPYQEPMCFLGRLVDRFDMRPVSMRNALGAPAGADHVVVFTASGIFTPPITGPLEVFVVAGGGSGGGSSGASIASGGGGAGGVLYSTTEQVVAGTPIQAIVGHGGVGVSGFVAGGPGGNSRFGAQVAVGGGYGGTWQLAGAAGGSGGGGGENNGAYAGGAGTSGQGNAGGADYGNYYSGTESNAGGGGGAGAAGARAPSATAGGNGGAGATSTLADNSTAVYYGGGGGGAGSTTAGTGGTGGGAAGASGSTGTGSAGTDGLGGGGGGSLTKANEAAQPGGNGGKGVVIVRWLGSFLTDPFSDRHVIYGGTPAATGLPFTLLQGAEFGFQRGVR